MYFKILKSFKGDSFKNILCSHPFKNLGYKLDVPMFEADFGAAVNTKTGPESTIAKVVDKISSIATIVIRGDLQGRIEDLVKLFSVIDFSKNNNIKSFVLFLIGFINLQTKIYF